MNWLKKLLGICDHKWITKKAYEFFDGEYYAYSKTVCRCEKCGVWRSFKV